MGYWVQPEDLTANWASLREKFQSQAAGKGGYVLILSVMAEHGLATAVLEAEYLRLEPHRTAVFKTGEPVDWWAVIRRLRSKAPDHGRALLRTHVTLDAQENPVVWTEPACCRAV